MAESRHVNGILKAKERLRREQRLIESIKERKLPYRPAVMSWLSAKLGKPSRLITQAEVDALVEH
jgi:hypothetical protein